MNAQKHSFQRVSQLTIADWFCKLDLPNGASLSEVEESYRELVKVWNPDRFADDPTLKAKAAERLREIKHAYESLREEFEISGEGEFAKSASPVIVRDYRPKTVSTLEPRKEEEPSASSRDRMNLCQTFIAFGFFFFIAGMWANATDEGGRGDTGLAILFWMLCIPCLIGFWRTK